MKVVAFLPAKGTSERVLGKNMRNLAGKPLFQHLLETLLTVEEIDEVYIDSDSDEILEIGKGCGAIPLKREAKFANNNTDGHQLFMNQVRQVKADIYIQGLGTSPFIKKETIQRGINTLKASDNNDSVVLVRKEKLYLWRENRPTYNRNHVPNSKDLEDTIIETMGLYMTKREIALKLGQRYGEKPYLLEASKIEAFDIDTPEDFEFANIICSGIIASKQASKQASSDK